MREYTVYIIRNLVDGKVYVGRTSQYRIRVNAHKGWARRGEKVGHPLYDAMRQHGIDRFEFVVIAEGLDAEASNAAEVQVIDLYGARMPSTGYNTSPGGDDLEFRSKIALAKRERLKSEDPEAYFQKYSKASKTAAARTPPAIRSERAKRRDAKLTAEQKSARGLAGFLGTTPEGRHRAAMKRVASWEPQSTAAHMTAMQAAIKAKRAAMTPQERSEVAFKGWASRRAKRETTV